MEQQTGSKLEKEYVKAVYCHPAYLTSMQSTSWETLGWKKHKLESRLPGEISIMSDMQMTLPFCLPPKFSLLLSSCWAPGTLFLWPATGPFWPAEGVSGLELLVTSCLHLFFTSSLTRSFSTDLLWNTIQTQSQAGLVYRRVVLCPWSWTPKAPGISKVAEVSVLWV